MNRQEHSHQNCQICHKQIKSNKMASHKTQCLRNQRQRRSQQQQQQQRDQQQRQSQQRINNSFNYNIQYIQDSSDSELEGMPQFPNFNQIFGPSSYFQRSMENMRHQMNEAFNINLNFGSDLFQINLQTNGNQRQHIYINSIGPEIQAQQFFHIPSFQFIYDDDDDSDLENQSHPSQEPEAQQIRQAQPMSLSEIKRIPTQKYIPNKKNKNCVICMIDFKKSDNVKILHCFHQFHAKCINQWLKQKGECPVCRHQLK